MSFENDGNFFTYIWMIENFGMNRKRKSFSSPTFAVKKFSNTKWYLKLYPGGAGNTQGILSCFLTRSIESEGPQEIKITFDLFLVEDIFTLPKFKKSLNISFAKGRDFGYKNINCGFDIHRNIPEKIYLICYMWMSEADVKSCTLNDSKITQSLIPDYLKPNSMPPECSKEIFSNVSKDIREIQKKMYYFPNYCFARTIISVERKSLSWPLIDILSTEDKKLSIIVTTISDIPDLLVTVFSNAVDSIQVTIRKTEIISDVAFVSVCKISISDSSGKIRHSIETGHYFKSKDSSCWNFQLECRNSEEEDQQPLELSLCHLYCEITSSRGDMVSCLDKIPNFHSWCYQDVTVNTSSANKLQERMSNIYASKLFCDVTLRSPDKTFEAHKVILCENSPVFKAMLQSGMKENETGVINIEDMESDTLNCMLKYMYSDSLEALQFEEALKLYEAADKYQLLSLQQKCAGLLVTNLSVENVCAALCLANAHQDNKLKTVVSQFIMQHAKEILPSEEWKIFLNDNTQLANEILQKMCMKSLYIQYKLK